MASIYLTGRGNPAEIVGLLANGIPGSAMSCQLIDSVRHEFNGITSYLFVFDKYYMRNSSRASLTVSVIGNGTEVCVDAVGSGGGQGALFNFSWGAEEDFVNTVADILAPYGFRLAG